MEEGMSVRQWWIAYIAAMVIAGLLPFSIFYLKILVGLPLVGFCFWNLMAKICGPQR